MRSTKISRLGAFALVLLTAFSTLGFVAPTSARGDDAKNAKNAKDAKFQQISDVVYKKVGDREIKLNLFLPLKDGETIQGEPLLIYLDSGCWFSGEPGQGGFWAGSGAIDRGFAVASVSHRSISEATFPAPMEDVRAAVRFLRKNAEQYGYDPTRFAVCGYSSGGNLSLTLGISDQASIYEVGDNLDVSGQVQRVVDFYGPADFAVVFERYSKQSIDCIFQAFGVERADAEPSSEKYAELLERAKKYSPITYVDADFAPTLMLHGTDDTIVPISQSATMFDSLRIAGVRAKFFASNGGVHDGATIAVPQTQRREVYEFLGW